MMPKFQAEMQFASYLSGYGTSKDLPASDSSRTWLRNNNDQIQINGHGYNNLSSFCNTSQNQDHEKEMLKKIMLQHEATFKHQVNELHCLYKRQRELMDEVKMRELSTNNIEGKSSKSNPIIFNGLSKSKQTYEIPSSTLVNASCHWPSSTPNVQAASNFDAAKSMQEDPNTSIIASSPKDTVLLPSCNKEFRKRTFDLELPADEYIDCEEERFEEGIVSGVFKAPKDLSSVCHQKDQLNSSEGNSVRTNLIPSMTNQADLNIMFQLKKEGTLCSTSRLPLDTSNLEKPNFEQSSQNPKTAFQIQGKEIDCMQVGKDLETRSESLYLEKVTRKHEHASSNYLISATKPFDTPAPLSKNATLPVGNYWLNNNVCLSKNSTYDPRSPSVGSLQNNFLHKLSSKDVDSSSMFSSHLLNLTNSLEKVTAHGNEKLEGNIQGVNWLRENLVPGEITDKVKESLSQGLGLRPPKSFLMSSSDVEPKSHTSDILNFESMHGSFDNSQITSGQLSKSHPNLSEVKVADNYEKFGILDRRSAHALTVSKMKCYSQGEMLKNGVYRKCQIDLNSSLNEDGSAQVEVGMKRATDITLEPPVSPENKESSPPRGNSVEKQPTEFVKLTEQDDKCQKDLALVAAEVLVLISSTGVQLYMNNSPSKPCETSATCLEWFARIVSSASDVLDEENGTVPGEVADSNHSELLTDGLNNFASITPQSKEIKFEEYCSSSTGNKKRIGLATSSSLPKRKRTRRTKSQKEMQGDILPQITFPLKQEASQEIHIISGLRENEGKSRFGKKKLSKNDRQRGKQHSSKSNVVQHPMCSYSEQQTDELDSLEGCLPCWGRKNKRQSSQRRPAPIRALI